MPPGLQNPPKNPKIQGFGEIPENPGISSISLRGGIGPIAAGWPETYYAGWVVHCGHCLVLSAGVLCFPDAARVND